MDPAISFEGVSKRFLLRRGHTQSFQALVLSLLQGRLRRQREEFWAVRDLDLEIAPGEAVGFVGQNGAGKSTVLKLITGIIRPTTGKVRVNGRIGALLELGAGFHPDLTGRENIFLNGSILGMDRKEIEDRLEDIISFADLHSFVDVPVRNYSSGMYVRLGFSIAIHTEPDILLVDEVLAVGDATFQRACLERIGLLQQQGVTTVLVSHDMDQIAKTCDTAYWLDEGVLQLSGAPRKVIREYLAAAAAAEQARRVSRLLETPAEPTDKKTRLYERGAPHPAAMRWGDGQIAIKDVRMFGTDARPVRTFYPDQPMRIEFDYAVQSNVKTFPAFGIGIFRKDGVWCYGTNTLIEGAEFPFETLPPSGTIVVELPLLQLLHGDYTLDVAIHDASLETAHDYIREALRFTVRNSKGDQGVFRPASRWSLEPLHDGALQ